MDTDIFTPHKLVTDKTVSEKYTTEIKEKHVLFSDENCDSFLETLGDKIYDIDFLEDKLNCKLKSKKTNVLGEYYPKEERIKYYSQTPEILEITKIHERFHATHHLLTDKKGKIWDGFLTTSTFFKELLAQLFTYIYIRDNNNALLPDFIKLNKNQPLLYKTYKIFKHYSKEQAIELYWIIRNKSDRIYKSLKVIEKNTNSIKKIEDALINGIRKTIIRFRKRPLNYFTESDIHSSLMKDIMEGNSDILLYRDKISNIEISLLHNEYPTNFKFSRKEYVDNSTDNEDIIKRRGNFDLVILDPFIIEKIKNDESFLSFLKTIIAKDIQRYEEVHEKLDLLSGEEILYAIEVKFIHFKNLGESIFKQVNVDNKKLECAKKENSGIKPINLIFCYYSKENKTKKENFVSENLKTNPVPNEILNIYIDVNIDDIGKKETIKPIWIYNCSSSVPQWVKQITKNYTKANEL